LASPSRRGSSPISSSSRLIRPSNSRSTSASSFCNSLLTRVFDIIVFRLPQHQPAQFARLHLGSENFPESGDDVLGGRNDSLHERNIEIEVLVIDDVDDLAHDDFLDLGEDAA